MVSAFQHSRAILALLLLTAVVRGGVLWGLRGNLAQDPDAYREIAENLIRHGEFALGGDEWYGMVNEYRPTAYRPPLYPILLSNLAAADGQTLSLLKVGLLHIGLGVATVWLTWLTASRVGAASAARAGPSQSTRKHGGPAPAAGLSHPTMPLLAGFFVAFDPILLHQQTLVMTETLAAFLAILSLWCLVRLDERPDWWNAALAGGAIGLAVLCRPTFLPWLGLVAVAYLGLRIADCGWRIGALRRSWRQVVNVAVLVAAAAVMVSPWVIRNYRVFGKPIATTTHGGYTLLLGNNPSFYKYLRQGETELPWDAKSLRRGLNQLDDNEYGALWARLVIGFKRYRAEEQRRGHPYHEEIWADYEDYTHARFFIENEPVDFLRACLYRLGQLWSPLPHQLTLNESVGRRVMRYAICGWYCGVYLLAGVGVWTLRVRLLRPPWLWGVLLCLVFTGVHTFYWSNLRMRAPLMPFVALVAAVGSERLIRGYLRRDVSRNGQLPGGSRLPLAGEGG